MSDSLQTPWTVAHQAPLTTRFSRQEHWSGLSCPPPGGSSQPRDRTQVSRTAGGFFTIWAISLPINGQIVYDKETRNIQWRKDTIFNEQCWRNWSATCKRIELGPYLTPHPNINSDGLKTQNHKTPRGNYTLVIIFVALTLKQKATKAKKGKWEYIKLKIFCTRKGSIKR